MDVKNKKIAVIGSGPGGTMCALGLNADRSDITVFDKAEFPRDKTCGDAFSIEAVKSIRAFDNSIYDEILATGIATEVNHIVILSGKETIADLDTNTSFKGAPRPFISRRYDVDNLLHARLHKKGIKVKNKKIRDIREIAGVLNIIFDDGSAELFDLVVFASGSVILPNKLVEQKITTKHFYGIRQYVKSELFQPDSMYFVLHEDKLPAYCWVFPMGGNTFNIGIYFDTNTKLNGIKNILGHFKNVDSLKAFAESAVEISPPMAYHIPYNPKVSNNIAGKNYLVIGTAAGLTDPLTGEGISHAVRSGIIAAEVLNKMDGPELSAALQKEFVKKIAKNIMVSSKHSRMIQQLFSYRFTTKFLFFFIKHSRFSKFVFLNTNKIRKTLMNLLSR